MLPTQSPPILLMRRLLIFILCIHAALARAQQPPVTDVATMRESTSLYYHYSYTFRKLGFDTSDLLRVPLEPVGDSASAVTKARMIGGFNYLFSFGLTNSSASDDTVWFFPGVNQHVKVMLYDTATRQFTTLLDTSKHVTPYTLEVIGFYTVIVPAGGYRQLFVQTRFHHYNWDYWDPHLYKPNTIGDKMLMYRYPDEVRNKVMALILLGILLAILVYTLILYFQYRQQEYLWYLAYVFMISSYFMFMAFGDLTYASAYHKWDMFAPAFTQIFAHLIYFFFVKRILNLQKNMPFFNKIVNVMIVIVSAYLVFHTLISFDDVFYPLNALGFFYIRIILCVFSLYGIVVLYRSRIPLSGYIATGVLCLTVLGLISMVVSLVLNGGHPFLVLIGGSITIFRLGVVIELFLFLLAITKKSKQEIINKIRTIELLQVENQRKELEKSMIALETQTAERKRISAEMHDDIGSGLTTIQFLSNTLGHDNKDKQDITVNKITQTSQQLMDKMNEIVWSLNQDFDTLPDTIAYIRNTVSELLENAGIQYEFNVPDQLPARQLSGIVRRNIYLVVKEATHNVIKHAGATKVTYTITINGQLTISIHDNGNGISSNGSQFGNGLKNMKQRMKDSGGSFDIRNGNGTLVTLEIPVPK
jgi:signal transduction histidine kinase